MIIFKVDQSRTSLPDKEADSLYFMPYVSESTELHDMGISDLFRSAFARDVSHAETMHSGGNLNFFECTVGWERRELEFSRCLSVVSGSEFEDSSIAKGDDAREARDLICSWEKNGDGKLASFYAVFFVETGFRRREYKKINKLLSDIDVDDITEWSIVALLRSSFFARSYLPAWGGLLSAAREKLEREGKDAHRILRGLNR